MPSASPIARSKPGALRPGDTIAIVAPASNIKPESLEAGCQALRELGYKPFYLDSILQQDLYFAGSVERRTRELEQMFMRPEVRAIVCARGGYGANYLLQAINLDVIKSHPKIFVGYSDVTTLLTYFVDTAGVVAFHGPMVTKDFSHAEGVDLSSWKAVLTGQANWTVGPESGVKPLLEGKAEGILYGGCLSMLVASVGTPFEIHTEDTILFLEDVAAKPFQIDRMLMQLKLAGKLQKVRGIIFGEMLDCVQRPNQDYTLEQVVVRVLRDLHVPLAFGLRSGHVSGGNVTLPLGVHASLEVAQSTATFRILESATVLEASQQVAKDTKAHQGSA